jgi:hypothetical protein
LPEVSAERLLSLALAGALVANVAAGLLTRAAAAVEFSELFFLGAAAVPALLFPFWLVALEPGLV